MEKLIGRKRNPDIGLSMSSENINNDKNDKNVKNEQNYLINNNDNNDSMKKLVDECFNDFIKGETNKLIENYNLLKQKFYESI